MRTKAVVSANRKKIVQEHQEDEFREALRDLIDVNFKGLREVGVTMSSSVMFLTSAKLNLSDLRKLLAIAEHQSRYSRRKFGWYARHLRNFDRRLGLAMF